MTEMIERVARTLSTLAGNAPHEDWRPFETPARAAIAAMAEPTGAMTAAGAEFFEESTDKQNGFAAAIVYGAMIEAALAEKIT